MILNDDKQRDNRANFANETSLASSRRIVTILYRELLTGTITCENCIPTSLYYIYHEVSRRASYFAFTDKWQSQNCWRKSPKRDLSDISGNKSMSQLH